MAKGSIIGRWLKATAFGWFLSIVLILLLSGLFEGAGIHNMQFYTGVGIGLGVGYTQWRVLRRLCGVGMAWIWSAVAGLGLPFLLFDLLKMFANINLGDYYLLCSVCVGSLLTGMLQYRVLRPYTSTPAIWILACILGWIASVVTVLAINYTRMLSNNNWFLFIANLMLILAGGVVLGTITAPFISRMLKTARSD